MSAWEIIRDNFEDDHCRAFMLWMATQTAVPPEQPMSGRLAYSLCYGRQRLSWCVPKGGSGALTDALMRLIEAHGGMVLTGKSVQQLIVEDGRCAGVECHDGSRYRAGKAVLSTIHIKHLVDMAPRAAWGEDFIDAVEHLAGRADDVRHPLRDHRAAAMPGRGRHDLGRSRPGSWPSRPASLRMGYDFARGAVNVEDPPLLAVCPTVVDPARAPQGAPHR